MKMSNKVRRKKDSSVEIRKQLMEDLSLILSNERLTIKGKNNAINFAIYNWTEANGKYEGNQYWSFNAYESHAYNKTRANQLVHEHVVPRKVVREMINSLTQKDSLSLYLLFEAVVIAAVITKEEDDLFRNKYDGRKLRSDMPKEYYDLQKGREVWYKNPWARYYAVNENNDVEISIFKHTWGSSKSKDDDIRDPFLGSYKEVSELLLGT
jgi:hypothetical protein